MPFNLTENNVAHHLMNATSRMTPNTPEGESLLSLSCSAGFYDLSEMLIMLGIGVEDRGTKGDCTPLMEAASGGYVEITRLLIFHGADVNAKSSAGTNGFYLNLQI